MSTFDKAFEEIKKGFVDKTKNEKFAIAMAAAFTNALNYSAGFHEEFKEKRKAESVRIFHAIMDLIFSKNFNEHMRKLWGWKTEKKTK